MEIAEFVPLSQKTKKSVRAKKKALASIEETKRKEKERRVFKERGKVFQKISLRTGFPIEKVDRNTQQSKLSKGKCSDKSAWKSPPLKTT